MSTKQAPSKNLMDRHQTEPDYSICPSGEKFSLPKDDDYANEFKKMQTLVEKQRLKHREIVVVMGVGFVGSVMAGVVADSVDPESGQPSKFVIGMQRPSTRSFWKIIYLNRGKAPVEAEDPEVAPLIRRCVLEKKTLIASFTYDVLTLADVVVVDVQCDYHKETFGNVKQGHADIAALEASLKIIGEKIKPECMVLIETTVPPGTTEYVAYPIIKRAFQKRGLENTEPLLAHSFERVMPGRNYVASIRDFWRVCSGINAESRKRVTDFLSGILNVENYPLTVLDRPIESETCKIVENSYRATLLAFLDEWSLFSERNGVDLTKVIEAIKVRPTHSNIIFPGPGIGGYCLPKDGGLGVWAYHTLMGFEDDIFKMTPLSININDTRGLRVVQLVRDALRNMGKIVAALRMTINLAETIKGADAMVIAVRHQDYLSLDPDEMVKMAEKPMAVIDCFGILNDDTIRRYFELGCEVKGLGRGHVKRIKDEVRNSS